MITDALLTFADGVALNTGGAGDYTVGDCIDLTVASRNLGNIMGDQMFLVITVDTTATSGGSATGEFKLITDDNSSFSSATVLATSGAIAVATLARGYLVAVIPLPPSTLYERYLGLRQTTAVAAFTAGKINAFLTATPPIYNQYADGLAAGS